MAGLWVSLPVTCNCRVTFSLVLIPWDSMSLKKMCTARMVWKTMIALCIISLPIVVTWCNLRVWNLGFKCVKILLSKMDGVVTCRKSGRWRTADAIYTYCNSTFRKQRCWRTERVPRVSPTTRVADENEGSASLAAFTWPKIHFQDLYRKEFLWGFVHYSE